VPRNNYSDLSKRQTNKYKEKISNFSVNIGIIVKVKETTAIADNLVSI